MNQRIVPIGLFLLSVLWVGCSTTKNTPATRAYHGMKVVHNVYFNGQIAFDEGMAAISKAGTDDYSTVLNLYPISDEKAQQAAVSEMEKCIEKCRKCIKLHSIHAKPAVNPKRQSDPEYRNWLKSKEFNAQMYRAWLLLAQAEFHKGDFLGSVGTFNYVSQLYSNDPDIVAQCRLWVARAYAEMGWQYEAEELLSKVKPDHLKRSHQTFYSAVSADIALKGKHYREAIPFVKVAKRGEKRRLYKPRFEFVLGQLYQRQGQTAAAAAAYKRVMQMQPAHEMDLQARLRYYELQGDTTRSMRQLRRMTRLEKNKEVLDLLYGTMGNVYLANGDTVQALRCYEQGMAASKKNGTDKARIAVAAGDLYFAQHAYEQAAPCYDQARQLLPVDHEAYDRVSQRGEVLSELVTHTQTVRLQDSLQYLSTLTEEEQRAVVEQVIADLIAKEQADSISNALQSREQELYGERRGVDIDMMPGMARDNSWYFYNEDLLRKGKQQFQRQWGTRQLEDNWRRQSKSLSAVSRSDETQTEEPAEGLLPDATEAAAVPVTDNHQPEYYLQQIPKTPEERLSSDRQIADALYSLIGIYRDRLNDPASAHVTLEDFERRFGSDERLPDLYYRAYLSALKAQDEATARLYRDVLMSRFADSEQAHIVGTPGYLESLQRMVQEQDSVYADTYAAYRVGQYATVKTNTAYAREHFSLSPLMPRFMFLNAVAEARTAGQEPFRTALEELVEQYPSHELSAMAKRMLAMMGEGQQARKGSSDPSSLQAQREEALNEPEEQPAEVQREPENALLLVIAHNEQNLNELLYEVALFNFSQFLIKDFDLQTFIDYSSTESALKISGFESPEEVEWYRNILNGDAAIQTKFAQLGVTQTQL